MIRTKSWGFCTRLQFDLMVHFPPRRKSLWKGLRYHMLNDLRTCSMVLGNAFQDDSQGEKLSMLVVWVLNPSSVAWPIEKTFPETSRARWVPCRRRSFHDNPRASERHRDLLHLFINSRRKTTWKLSIGTTGKSTFPAHDPIRIGTSWAAPSWAWPKSSQRLITHFP